MAKTVISSSSDENSDNGIQFEVHNCDSERSDTPKIQSKAKDFRILDFLRRHVALVSICALGIVTVLLIVTIIILLQRNLMPITVNIVSPGTNASQQKENPDRTKLTSDPTANVTPLDKHKFISRLEWMAQPPVQPPNPLQAPVPYVLIHNTATDNCSSEAQCIFHIRYIQAFHIESRNWWDIGYNFLVGGDGRAYEGRGWKSEGAHALGYNGKSIGIAFIGTFNTIKPPQRQIIACKQLIAKGVELGYIQKDYKLLAARQIKTTQSPGAALYEDVKSWDHWVASP